MMMMRLSSAACAIAIAIQLAALLCGRAITTAAPWAGQNFGAAAAAGPINNRDLDAIESSAADSEPLADSSLYDHVQRVDRRRTGKLRVGGLEYRVFKSPLSGKMKIVV